jgi:hypothetical protein
VLLVYNSSKLLCFSLRLNHLGTGKIKIMLWYPLSCPSADSHILQGIKMLNVMWHMSINASKALTPTNHNAVPNLMCRHMQCMNRLTKPTPFWVGDGLVVLPPEPHPHRGKGTCPEDTEACGAQSQAINLASARQHRKSEQPCTQIPLHPASQIQTAIS